MDCILKQLVIFGYLLPTLLGSGGLHLLAPASHHCHLHDHQTAKHAHPHQHAAHSACSCSDHQVEEVQHQQSDSDDENESQKSGEPCFLCDYISQQAVDCVTQSDVVTESSLQSMLSIYTVDICSTAYAPQCLRGPPARS